MSQFRIPMSYTGIDYSGLSDVLNSFSEKHHNEIVTEFESELRKLCDAPHVLSVCNGTAAIHLALKYLNVGPGDIVIAPTFTYVATASPILYLGAEPLFVDSERLTWNMDSELLETALKDLRKKNRRVAAIILVHAYGMPAQVQTILEIADKYEVPVVEDAAEALGSLVDGRQVGTFSTVGILSFNNNKLLTTYGGGAILTTDQHLLNKTRYWSAHSRDNLPYYHHQSAGYNYRISPLNAAMGLSQLKLLTEKIEKRRRIFERYASLASDLDLKFLEEPKTLRANRWLTTVLFADMTGKDRVANGLISRGIEVRPLWNPMHCQPLFRGASHFTNGVSEDLFARGLCLPSSDNLTPDLQEEIVRNIRELLCKI